MNHYNISRNIKGQFLKGSESFRKGKTLEKIFGIKMAKRMKKKMSISKKGKSWDEIWGKEGAEKRRVIQMPQGSNHPHWKGGKVNAYGYILIRCVGHPKATKRGHYVREHVLISEKALGRYLKKGEIVYHINGDKVDNRNSNLLICNIQYHNRLKTRMTELYQKEHFGKEEKDPDEEWKSARDAYCGIREDE